MRMPSSLLAALAILLTAHVAVAQSQREDGSEENEVEEPLQKAGRTQASAPSSDAVEQDAEGNYRLEVVTFPKEVQDADSNMNKEALLYHPIKKPEGNVPLVVLLHGAGGTKKQDISAFKGNRDVKWIMTPANGKYVAKILVPHSRSHWSPDALNKAVDHLLSTHSDIDKDRIYCIGYSMGGLGTWNWARHSPERLAAIVPVAFIANQDDLKKMVDLPIWAMVGTADRQRAGSIPAMEKALKELGSTKVRTTIFEGANHAQTAAKAWAQEGLLDWLFAQSCKK